jgi:zinc-ribbon domain
MSCGKPPPASQQTQSRPLQRNPRPEDQDLCKPQRRETKITVHSILRTTAIRPSSQLLSLATATTLLALALSVLAFSAPAAHAQTPPDTQWESVIAYSTTSGYTPQNVNFTWTNTDTCGTFAGEYPPGGPDAGDAPSAYWEYGPGVGATPCTASLPSGTITETISSGGAVLASCTDTQGAATYGKTSGASGDTSAPGCTTAGTGVVITYFYSQAYDAAGNPIAVSSGNDDWVIALAVIVILILLLLFFYMRRRRKTAPVFASAQTPSAPPGIPPAVPSASVAKFCRGCGSPVEPGASFCPSCGKAL